MKKKLIGIIILAIIVVGGSVSVYAKTHENKVVKSNLVVPKPQTVQETKSTGKKVNNMKKIVDTNESICLANINKYIAAGKKVEQSDYNTIVKGEKSNNESSFDVAVSISANQVSNLNNPKKLLETYKGLSNLYYSDAAVYYTLMQKIQSKDIKTEQNVKEELKMYNAMRKTEGIKGLTPKYEEYVKIVQGDLNYSVEQGIKVAKAGNEPKSEVVGEGQKFLYDCSNLGIEYASILKNVSKNEQIITNLDKNKTSSNNIIVKAPDGGVTIGFLRKAMSKAEPKYNWVELTPEAKQAAEKQRDMLNAPNSKEAMNGGKKYENDIYLATESTNSINGGIPASTKVGSPNYVINGIDTYSVNMVMWENLTMGRMSYVGLVGANGHAFTNKEIYEAAQNGDIKPLGNSKSITTNSLEQSGVSGTGSSYYMPQVKGWILPGNQSSMGSLNFASSGIAN